MIEIDLKGMRAKILRNKEYECFYDEQLGALSVYKILERTAELQSSSRLISELIKMRTEKPPVQNDAYQQERVVSGWEKTIDKLIKGN